MSAAVVDPLPCYRFADFTLDCESRTLFRERTIVETSDRTVQLLQFLLQRPGVLVGKYDLIESLWPDQDVTEWSLSRLVSDTRQLLGDNADQQLIQTIRGQGFRLNPDIEVELVERPAPLFTKNRSVRSSWLVAAGFVAAVAIALFYYYSRSAPPSQLDMDLPIVVLPVNVRTGDDQDSWARYGVTTVLTGQLQRFAELQVADVDATIRALGQIDWQGTQADASDELYNRVCVALGCRQLVELDLTLTANGVPNLRYTVHTESSRSRTYEFVNADVLQATKALFEHLLQRLLPPEPERVVVEGMYTEDLRANQNFALGASSVIRGEFDHARGYLGMALEQNPDFFWARAYMSDVLVNLGEYASAELLIDELVAGAVDRRRRMYLEKVQSNLAYERGNLEDSVTHTQTMLDLAVELDDEQAQGLAYMHMGASWQALGKNKPAQNNLVRALDIFQHGGYRLREAQTIFNLGNVYYTMSDFEDAEARYVESADMFRRLGAPEFLSYARYALSTLKMSQGRLDQARADFTELRRLYEEQGEVEGVLLADSELGTIALMEGDLEKAEELLRGAYVQAGDTYTYVRSWTSGLLALCYLNQGDAEMAAPYIEERTRFGWFDARTPMVFIPASHAHLRGDYAQALELARDARARIGDEWTELHEDWLRAFEQAAQSGKPVITDYYDLAGEAHP